MAKIVILIIICFLLSLITESGPDWNAMNPPSWEKHEPVIITVKQY